MAVYTHVSDGEAKTLLGRFDIGALIRIDGIPQGVENTNYHLYTDQGRYILTLFEKRVDPRDLPFFIELMAHLAARGVAAPDPVRDRDGAIVHRLADRPATITTFLPGAPRMNPTAEECAALGRQIAAMHLAVADFQLQRENALGLAGWRKLAEACAAGAYRCAPGLAGLIEDELAHQEAATAPGLPGGVVHADLFPDNVFFEGDRLSGVIDWYFACNDAFAYDLAIALNALCWRAGWRDDNASALMRAYAAVRPLSDGERAALPALLRGAALRFLLTRLYDWLNQVDGALVTVKDPLEYRDILLHHRQGAAAGLWD